MKKMKRKKITNGTVSDAMRENVGMDENERSMITDSLRWKKKKKTNSR